MTLMESYPQRTFTAPVNIAVIKYWGKRDAELNLPTNSSISLTLDQRDLKTTTTAAALVGQRGGDKLWLNGKEVVIAENKRLSKVIAQMRGLAKEHSDNIPLQKRLFYSYPLSICSVNNFPTAAGLASSASGYACLVAAVCSLYGLDAVLSTTEMSRLARLGSGSASRSLFGGFVEWTAGDRKDGLDSEAVQIAPESHWDQMRAFIFVVRDSQKDVSSTAGMQTTVCTSSLLQRRIAVDVPERVALMRTAISEKNFDVFAKLTMQDSNSFHACCLDTYPPIFYMNDTSRFIVSLVNAYNEFQSDGSLKAAYTFDAGPNAVVYTLHEHAAKLLALAQKCFPLIKIEGCVASTLGPSQEKEFVTNFFERYPALLDSGHSLQRILSTKVGPGVLESSEISLLSSDGTPLS